MPYNNNNNNNNNNINKLVNDTMQLINIHKNRQHSINILIRAFAYLYT